MKYCEFCEFWVQLDESKTGVCRRYPPSVSEGFPYTAQNVWCGEWSLEGCEEIL